MNDRLSPEGLRYARAVSRTGSFSAAVRGHGVAQLALFNAVRRLEKVLGAGSSSAGHAEPASSPPPGRGAGDPNASSALPAVAGGVPDPPVPPIVDVVDVDEVAHRPLLLVSDICGLTTVTRGPLTGRGLSLRDYSREVAGYRVLEDWAGALILRCRRWCAGQAGIEAPPDIEGASWGSKELLVRDEDVQVLHGFETLEQANAYLTSELFTTRVVPGLTPLFKADPDIRVYTVA